MPHKSKTMSRLNKCHFGVQWWSEVFCNFHSAIFSLSLRIMEFTTGCQVTCRSNWATTRKKQLILQAGAQRRDNRKSSDGSFKWCVSCPISSPFTRLFRWCRLSISFDHSSRSESYIGSYLVAYSFQCVWKRRNNRDRYNSLWYRKGLSNLEQSKSTCDDQRSKRRHLWLWQYPRLTANRSHRISLWVAGNLRHVRCCSYLRMLPSPALHYDWLKKVVL